MNAPIANSVMPRPEPLDRSHAFLKAFDELDYGVILIDRDRTLQYANRAAMKDCLGKRLLRLVAGRIEASDESLNRRLQTAIIGAFDGRRRMVTLELQGDVHRLAVVPLGGRGQDGPNEEVLILSGRTAVCEPLSVALFAREVGLTAAETDVLRRLGCGMPPAKVASECGVALSTVRTHIGSLRMKTGARTIGEVVRLLSLLPPVVSALSEPAGAAAGDLYL